MRNAPTFRGASTLTKSVPGLRRYIEPKKSLLSAVKCIPTSVPKRIEEEGGRMIELPKNANERDSAHGIFAQRNHLK
jgi:hypothetical protein